MAAHYQTDLAHVHHAGFSEYSARAGRWLLEELARRGLTRGTVVDLGCGGGTFLELCARAGLDAVGVDQSQALATIARLTAPSAEVHVGSAHAFELPRCVAVTAFGEVLGYLAPAARKAPALAPLFRRVARALEPGGVFLFDLLVEGAASLSGQRAVSTPSWTVLSTTSEDRRACVLTRDIVTFVEEADGRYRRSQEQHRLAVHERGAVVEALQSAGFVVRTLRAIGEQPMLPRRVAFFARKPTRAAHPS
ncbi:MAG: class I SAM-dependent methyltransferase [Polyangiaceae bacterium]